MYGKNEIFKARISILLPIHANYEKITFYTVIDMRESCYEVFLDSVTQTCEISFSAFFIMLGYPYKWKSFKSGSTEKMTNWSKAVGDNPKHKGRIPLQVKGQTQHQKITPQPQNEKETLKHHQSNDITFQRTFSVNSKVITCLLVR